METYYYQFDFKQKISLTTSMFALTKNFLKSYDWNLSDYDNDEEIINDLYFYWLRMSASKQYAWCKEHNDSFLSSPFALEMKIKLKSVLFRVLIQKRYPSSKRDFSKNRFISV